MNALRLLVQNPKGAWCHHVGLEFPDVAVRVLSYFVVADGEAQETVQFSGSRWREALSSMKERSSVLGAEILEEAEAAGKVRLTIVACHLASTIAEARVSPDVPFEVRDGKDEWTVLASRDKASLFREALAKRGVESDLVSFTEHRPENVLTERQAEILKQAVAAGYYEYPRRITLSKLAKRVGIAKSTLSQSLMTIERAMAGKMRRA